ncbi:hypothetical protein Tsubulata_018562 [Turnera subulata]|uniref:Uncharacterized protein n=1 Tax=Turnera subulata TaxID=218843 RepID=A0A9Q0F1H5_9ROSI|nr:hypothetical protein Tsubulata_018562 [Turnera subulata]
MERVSGMMSKRLVLQPSTLVIRQCFGGDVGMPTLREAQLGLIHGLISSGRSRLNSTCKMWSWRHVGSFGGFLTRATFGTM